MSAKERENVVSYGVQHNNSEDEGLVGGEVGLRMVGNIAEGNTTGNPIVGAVLEQVEDGHGGVAELVNQEGFQLPLHKVGHNQVEDQAKQEEQTANSGSSQPRGAIRRNRRK